MTDDPSNSAFSEGMSDNSGDGTNKQLSASLRADFEALENDLEQANAMALDLQGQLAGKSNEFAQLKHVFEKTSRNLAQLQKDISELREERHHLANEAMKATALEFNLQKTKQERDRLNVDLETQRVHFEEQIARLKEEFRNNNRPAVISPRPSNFSSGERLTTPQAASLLDDIVRSVAQLRELTEKPVARATVTRPKVDSDFIKISFSEQNGQEAEYS